jgi:lycopene beta-cyclase
VLLHGGEKIVADAAIDAREAANWSMLDLAWRRYAARDFTFSAPHRVDRPVLIDATIGDGDFAACLPLGEARMRVERSSYGRDGAVPAADEVEAYARGRGWHMAKAKAREAGAVPVALGGDFQAFWRLGGARVAKLGPRGGLFNALTGSPLGDALGTALLLTRQRDFSGAALHDLFERHAAELWARRDFHRGINALLLRDGGSGAGRVLERLYGLDPALVAAFYAGRPGLLDRRRIMAAASR